MGETVLDERGRILIPKEIRERLELKPNQSLIIEVRGREVVLKPASNIESFAMELKGCVSGSKVKPSELKEIWGVAHAHH